MSERDFETYLSLLGRLLRLSPSQRESIEAELRDHMEQRLDELLDKGLTREQAIDAALEEFGDAAGLAHNFTTLTRQHRRRLIMRYSFASLCALALAATVFLSVLPERHDVAIQPVTVAHEPAPPETAAAEAPIDPTPQAAAATHAKLAQWVDDVAYDDVPFGEVINQLRQLTSANIVVQRHALDASGLDPDAPVTLHLKRVPAQKVLQLVLDQIGGRLTPLDYTIDNDGIVVISTAEQLSYQTEIRMYNVRDLASMEQSPVAPDRGGFTPFGGPGAPGGRSPMRSVPAESALIHLIIEQIEPDTWRSSGGVAGVISFFDGTLIVKHTPKVHEQVNQFLQMLRQARASETGEVISGLSIRVPAAARPVPHPAPARSGGFGPGLGGFDIGTRRPSPRGPLPGVRAPEAPAAGAPRGP